MQPCTERERIDNHDKIIMRFDKFIAVMEIRNEYDEKNQERLSKAVEELVAARIEHDKRITALEGLPAQVKDIQESRTIKTDLIWKDKIKAAIPVGITVASIVAVVGVLMTLILFLQKVYEVSQNLIK